ncbi:MULTISPECIES: undecaprenyl-diphosphate phosphatase [Paraburkholderia]|uniref:Undecaprenyl-diphosphatase n=1 Tax=Paraburkholderia megapolitana TaxID=420953 RepID=A0A1I3IVR2_9BURK|nr:MULTISPECIES: undecaprenyl-diphosphate phosphatase [Paraburkholderia]MCX4160969.1 undecaprenyl-diphosphate phosphatase [Paraburkholderia megapolitana]MDN7156465.1 undecaprenyl-diphosphate phosphatase [Paraburkholderia sp. CHISQ3]MDQ6493510.1 undecaprenyl-diphosphate phosphatase [Paraburkholderia megapolitana]QDQ85029.1 undecaprenyl-diphosphate phosphatase [Paraburkholderia megapolitana]SFI52029.1 Undecaprenyl-diphosphatase [Paraburkholderia megapolitana]
MDWILICKALILGVVEGLTEFLPVSSTGHLIVAGSLLDFTDEHAKTFDVVIQLGAILAVCWEYRRRIGSVVAGLPTRPDARRFALNVIIATIPAVVLGLLFEKAIKSALFSPVPVAFALVAGGVLILWVESRKRERGDVPARVQAIDDLRPLDALKVGVAQCCALIPGMSRSGSTIIGGMLFGLDRRVATEFSFFLAIPIIFGATFYEMAKSWHQLSADMLGTFTIGFVAAFVSAFACVRWLLRYIATHDFTVFAWYRIGFGLLILLVGYSGGLGWA